MTLSAEAGSGKYDNHATAHVNDHVIRISTMTQPYYWRSYPNSDEAFLVVGGGLVIEFEYGEIQLAHRTRPVGRRWSQFDLRSR